MGRRLSAPNLRRPALAWSPDGGKGRITSRTERHIVVAPAVAIAGGSAVEA